MLRDALLIWFHTDQSQNRMITVKFKNFRFLRLIKVKALFEVDQGKCKWDLDLSSSTKKSSHTFIKSLIMSDNLLLLPLECRTTEMY